VLNLLRDLSPRFDRVTPILTRMKLFPTFAEAKNDLLLEELRLSATVTIAPATALYSAPRAAPAVGGGPPRRGGGGGGGGPRPRSQEWTRWHVERLRWLSGWFSVAILL
jgi:hypothetical protein